jgi:hypothetical protein
MKRTLAFCSFILLVVMVVIFAGVAVLIASYSQLNGEEEEMGSLPSTQNEQKQENEQGQIQETELSIESALILFKDEVDGFTALEFIGDDELDQQVYKITTSTGDDRYISWGVGAIAVPEGVTEISTGALNSGMERAWAFVEVEENLLLSKEVFILR